MSTHDLLDYHNCDCNCNKKTPRSSFEQQFCLHGLKLLLNRLSREHSHAPRPKQVFTKSTTLRYYPRCPSPPKSPPNTNINSLYSCKRQFTTTVADCVLTFANEVGKKYSDIAIRATYYIYPPIITSKRLDDSLRDTFSTAITQ